MVKDDDDDTGTMKDEGRIENGGGGKGGRGV